MHIQNHFRMSDDEAARLLANPGACDVVAWGGESLEASYLPMCFQPGGEHGSLTTHIAKINPLAAMDGAPAVAMVHGADAFIASAWLSDGEDVEAPGWNYLVLAAYGRLRIHGDREWIVPQVMEHSAALEPGFAPDSLTERYVETSLRSMVGLELVVDRVEAKAKMGQNQSPEKLRRVIAGLRGAGCAEVADWMERFSLSRAEDKQALLAGIRAKRAL